MPRVPAEKRLPRPLLQTICPEIRSPGLPVWFCRYVISDIVEAVGVVIMRNRRCSRSLVTFIGLVFTAAAVPAHPAPRSQPRTAATIEDLRSVDELKTMFNRDRGTVRLLLLLSPT